MVSTEDATVTTLVSEDFPPPRAWKTFGTMAIQRKLPVAPAEVDR